MLENVWKYQLISIFTEKEQGLKKKKKGGGGEVQLLTLNEELWICL